MIPARYFAILAIWAPITGVSYRGQNRKFTGYSVNGNE